MTTLLIPGLLCDSFVWQPLLQEMAADVADLSTQDSLTVMAQDCLDRYSGKLRVAGHSMGARVAMEMARLAPDRIERLALLDTGIHPLAEGEMPKREAVLALAELQGMEALANRWIPGMVWEPNQADAALMEGLRAMVLRRDAALHRRQITALINRPNAAADLPSIACPTLLVVGEHDLWSPVSQHQDMLELLRNARLEIIKDAGHFAPLERPQAVTPLLRAFLNAA